MSFVRGLPVGAGAGSIPGVTISGTPGSIAFFGSTGFITEDNSQLFYDDANNRQGIGINSSLAARLHIVGDGTPVSRPLALRVDSTPTLRGEILLGDITNSTYATEEVFMEVLPPSRNNARSRGFRYKGGVHVSIAGGEYIDFTAVLASVEFSSGTTLATQRGAYLGGQTYSANTAKTITTATTLYLDSPLAGTNVTYGSGTDYFTGAFALYSAGPAHFFGKNDVTGPSNAKRPPAIISYCREVITGLSSNYDYRDFSANAGNGIQWTTSAPSNVKLAVLTDGNTPLSCTSVDTITNAAAVYIGGAPSASTNITITDRWALWIQADVAGEDLMCLENTSATGFSSIVFRNSSGTFKSSIGVENTASNFFITVASGAIGGIYRTGGFTFLQFGSSATLPEIGVGTSATSGRLLDVLQPNYSGANTPVAMTLTGGSHTTLQDGDTIGVNMNFSQTVQFGNNTGRALLRTLRISPPTYSSSVATKAITVAATLQVTAAPSAGTNLTIGDSYAALFGAKIRVDSGTALGGGAAPTLGTIGGSGPTTAAQNEWIAIDTQNGRRFIPAWA